MSLETLEKVSVCLLDVLPFLFFFSVFVFLFIVMLDTVWTHMSLK